MTLLSSIMRDIGQHSSLIDLSTLRIVMGLSGYFPLPSDALVCALYPPITGMHLTVQ